MSLADLWQRSEVQLKARLLMAGEKTVNGLVTETQAAFQKGLDSAPPSVAR
jgi:hypothetical protein